MFIVIVVLVAGLGLLPAGFGPPSAHGAISPTPIADDVVGGGPMAR